MKISYVGAMTELDTLYKGYLRNRARYSFVLLEALEPYLEEWKFNGEDAAQRLDFVNWFYGVFNNR